MTRVLLANAPWRGAGRLGVRAGSRWPFTISCLPNQSTVSYTPFPFFMAYATAVLKQNVKARMVDAITEGMFPETFESVVSAFKPDKIVLETSTPSIRNDLGWAELLNKMTGAQVYLSGPHASVFAEDLLKHSYITGILKGEYDLSILEIIQHEGIIESKPVRDLDSLPYPSWEDLPMYGYHDYTSGLEKPVFNIMTSRGCVFDCSFCLFNQVMYPQDCRYRLRKVSNVIAEIKAAVVKYPKFRGVFAEDDTFGVRRDWVLEFAEAYKEINLPLCVLGRADLVDKELLTKLKQAGLHTFRFGVESGNQRIVDDLGKRLDLRSVRECIGWCNDLGIETHMTISYGLPGETLETVAETKKFIARLNPTYVTQSIATPYPGTRFFDYLKGNNLLETMEWSEYDGFCNAVYHTEGLSRRQLNGILSSRH